MHDCIRHLRHEMSVYALYVTGIHTDEQADRQTDRQTDRQKRLQIAAPTLTI